MARNQRVRREIKVASRPAFFVATVTAVDTAAHTITIQEAGEDPRVVPAAMGTYPDVGSLVLVMMNGDEPIVLNQLATETLPGGGPIGGGWSAWTDWTPKLGYWTNPFDPLTEPDYGATPDPIFFGRYRRNGPLVEARADIVLGTGFAPPSGAGAGDNLYLSLPLPSADPPFLGENAGGTTPTLPLPGTANAQEPGSTNYDLALIHAVAFVDSDSDWNPDLVNYCTAVSLVASPATTWDWGGFVTGMGGNDSIAWSLSYFTGT